MAAELDVVVLGDCNPDLVLSGDEVEPAFGQEERLVEHAELTIGGSGAIMACAAARLGLKTALVAVVGDDLFGRFMLEALRDHGVDTSAVIVDPKLHTGVTVVLARPDDRAILTFLGAIASLRPEHVDRDVMASARHVHVSSYFLQPALTSGSGLARLLASARDAGTSISVDPNWDPTGTWDGGLPALLPEIDVLLPNAAEACRIARCEDPRRAAQELAAHGPLVAVKLGPEGALAAAAGAEPVFAAAPATVDVVDAVGAGDAFDAGLVAARLAGASVAEMLALACACGTLSTRGAGGTSAQPTLSDARALLGFQTQP